MIIRPDQTRSCWSGEYYAGLSDDDNIEIKLHNATMGDDAKTDGAKTVDAKTVDAKTGTTLIPESNIL